MKVIRKGQYKGKAIDKIRIWKERSIFGIKFRIPCSYYILVNSGLKARRLRDLKDLIDYRIENDEIMFV